MEAAPPPINPGRRYVEPEQIVASAPAELVARRLIVSVMASLTAKQGPAGSLVVIVSTTVGEPISRTPGV